MAKVDPEKVPIELKPFVPYAEKWGEQDIDDRNRLVDKATIEELQDLTGIWKFCTGIISDWLVKPGADAASTIDEYVAFSCLILAVSHARSRLDQLNKE